MLFIVRNFQEAETKCKLEVPNNEPISPKILKISQECLQKSSKIKLSIPLHVRRRSIRSEPCYFKEMIKVLLLAIDIGRTRSGPNRPAADMEGNE